MSHEAVRKALEGRMQANWTYTPVAYENVEFERPTGATYGNAIAWAEFNILPGTGDNDGIKQKWKAQTGLIQCDFYLEQGKGTKLMSELYDLFEGLFENEVISGVNTRAAGVVNGAPTVNGFIRKAIQIPFIRYEAD